MVATIVYVALIAVLFVWLWKQLRRVKASTKAVNSAGHDDASHLAKNDRDHGSGEGWSDD
jgi:hypothetical protein